MSTPLRIPLTVREELQMLGAERRRLREAYKHWRDQKRLSTLQMRAARAQLRKLPTVMARGRELGLSRNTTHSLVKGARKRPGA